MNKRIASEIAFGIILIIVVVVGGIFWLQGKKEIAESKRQGEINIPIPEIKKPIESVGTVCTQEAKLCEDGKTYVSRTQPNCEFAACPVVATDGKVSVVTRNNKNYVIWEKNGTETIIDQGDVYSEAITDVSEVKNFSNVTISSSGNYVTYKATGWEWSHSYMYDLNLKKTIFIQDAANTFLFDDSEKYFVSCGASQFDGTFDGKIFNVGDFETPIFDITKYEKNAPKDYSSVACKVNGDLVIIYLNNDDWEGVDKDKLPANKTIKYSLSQSKVIK